MFMVKISILQKVVILFYRYFQYFNNEKLKSLENPDLQ